MLVCVALALAGTAAMAGEPIPGVDIIVRKNPGGDLIVHTDGSGRARLERLVPGNYTLTIRSASLAAAMERLAAPRRSNIKDEMGREWDAPAERGGSPGNRSHRGAVPPPGGARSLPSSGHQTSPRAGIAVGDLNGDGQVDAARRGAPVIQVVVDLGPAGRFSRTAPYRRDHAGEGLTLTFTIPNRGGARPSAAGGTIAIDAISDQASAGNLTSY
jgi:hypothetical protein